MSEPKEKIQKVFISGPYRASTEVQVSLNIAAARLVAVKYWAKGYAVFCPHLNSAFMGGICPNEGILKACLLFLEGCDIIVMMKGWQFSEGAKSEHLHAVNLNKRLIYDGSPYGEKEHA